MSFLSYVILSRVCDFYSFIQHSMAATIVPIIKDPTTRVNKKLKHQESTTHMDFIAKIDFIEDDNHQPLEDSDMAQGWGIRTFSEVLGGRSEGDIPPEFLYGRR